MRSLCVLLKLIPAIASAVWLCGCSVLIPTPPEAAVGDDQVSLAIRGFLDSSIILARAFSYQGGFVDESPVRATTTKIVGIGNKRTFTVENIACARLGPDGRPLPDEVQPRCSQYDPLKTVYGSRQSIMKDYIGNGLHLSRLLCRNYLAGLSEKNSAFSAIKKELNIAGGLAQLTLATAKASARSIAYFGAVESFINASLENFGEFEYLTPDQSTLQDLVYKAQGALGDYYTITAVPDTLVGAIDAVHRIDSQCTRAGLRHLINRSLTGVQVVPAADGSLTVTGTDKLELFNPAVPPSFSTLQAKMLKVNDAQSRKDRAYTLLILAQSDPSTDSKRIADLQKNLDDAQSKLDAAKLELRAMSPGG